jgi:hypothetical protein
MKKEMKPELLEWTTVVPVGIALRYPGGREGNDPQNGSVRKVSLFLRISMFMSPKLRYS